MNCPYCDESIHLMAKFCPKCGLPLKDDATLMGAPLGGEGGLSKWVLTAGAAGIVALALSIGWLSSQGRGSHTGTTVRREPVGRYAAPPNPQPLRMAALPRAPYRAPAMSGFGFGMPSKQAYTYNPQVKWAYIPPPQLPRPRLPAPDPEAPRQLLTGLPQPKRATVQVVRSNQAPIPEAPPWESTRQFAPERTFGWMNPAGVSDSRGMQLAVQQGLQLAPNVDTPGVSGTISQDGPTADRGNWVWDPVLERYAYRADRIGRRPGPRAPRSR